MDGMASSEELARLAQSGSLPAFEELVTRHEAALFNFLWVRTGNAAEAEELAQEAFLRAWQRLGSYDARWRFSTWLYTLARRLAVSAARARGREPRRADPDGELGSAAPADDPCEQAAARDEQRALWELAARVLRTEERSALWLRYGEDLAMDEIGRVLGRPAVSVRVLLFRARARLAAALGAVAVGGGQPALPTRAERPPSGAWAPEEVGGAR
jgi:RNA polymerase sigma-70 factor (ECF subfamily)